jgi:hypothetical protein
MKVKIWIVCLLAITAIFGCKNNNAEPSLIPVHLTVDHTFRDAAIEFDYIQYVNSTGTELSITRLFYFLSGFRLVNKNGDIYECPEVFYIDAKEPLTHQLFLGLIPEGAYSSISFNIGVTPELNQFGGLENTIAVNDMFWPEQMGGGYHCLKLEGRYLDSEENLRGFALHVGTNNALVDIHLESPFEISFTDHSPSLRMDINEWFENPMDFDLNDGNYSMGDSLLMYQLKENGSSVFTLVQ